MILENHYGRIQREVSGERDRKIERATAPAARLLGPKKEMPAACYAHGWRESNRGGFSCVVFGCSIVACSFSMWLHFLREGSPRSDGETRLGRPLHTPQGETHVEHSKRSAELCGWAVVYDRRGGGK